MIATFWLYHPKKKLLGLFLYGPTWVCSNLALFSLPSYSLVPKQCCGSPNGVSNVTCVLLVGGREGGGGGGEGSCRTGRLVRGWGGASGSGWVGTIVQCSGRHCSLAKMLIFRTLCSLKTAQGPSGIEASERTFRRIVLTAPQRSAVNAIQC